MSEELTVEHFNSALELVKERIQHLLEHRQLDAPVIVNINGPSASGKSTFSTLLLSQMDNCDMFSMDDYLAERLWDQTLVFNHDSGDPQRPYIAGIDPAIYDRALMLAHLDAIHNNKAVNMPIFDETIKDRTAYRHFNPRSILLVEGIYAFQEEFLAYSDLRVLVIAPLHDRLVRKMLREHHIYLQPDINEVLGRYFTRDEPSFLVYKQKDIEVADVVIVNKADPVNDYAMFEGKNSILINGRKILLVPHLSTGTLSPHESLAVIIMSDDSLWIQYSIEDKILLELPLSNENRLLLEKYYDYQ